MAALASAALASVCCLGPLVLAGLGLGSLGFAAGLVKYRPFFLALTAVILTVAFYETYRKREVVCPDGSCDRRAVGRAAKVGLWVVTALAAALAFFPNWSSRMIGSGRATAPAGAQVLALKISGMGCADCVLEIRRALEKVPGVLSADVDFSAGTARVASDGTADPRAVIAAVAAAGYKAALIGGEGRDGKPRS
ncbi:MAG: heavy-metal-associated domain-containing protein [Elusimicrobia bacterium]|nr:heavy-metal-associated domain-containing protein [Elusimicrobiota bacterium]